jgi:3-dehydroquinate synthase
MNESSREIQLRVAGGQSRIVIGTELLDHIGGMLTAAKPPQNVVVCSDHTVAGLYAQRVLQSLVRSDIPAALHAFPPGDASKCLSELDAIYGVLGKRRVGRDGMLLALGGGVVSDLTGFAAGTWMRGIRYATCPTTLEADVDASIGGKTGINHALGKNMVGVFHHPTLVAVDTSCLRTLPRRDLAAGLAESVKHALIRETDFLGWHEQHADAILAADPAVLAELVERNLRIKAAVVEADEREHGQRAILNFGHTIGHAIEAWFHYELRHGEAVALGMMAALRISEAVCGLPGEVATRVARLLEILRLPTRAPRPVDVEAVAALTLGDKKALAGARRWVLLEDIGRTTIRSDVPEGLVHSAVHSIQPDPDYQRCSRG